MLVPAEPSVQEPAGVDIAGQNRHLALDFGDRSADTMNMDWECPVGGQLWQRSCPFSFQGKTFQPEASKKAGFGLVARVISVKLGSTGRRKGWA